MIYFPTYDIPPLSKYHTPSNNTSPPLHILHNLRRQRPLIRQAHLRRKRRMRDPFRTIPRRRLLQHAIDLFQRQPFRFRNEEIGVEEAADAEGAPDEEDFGAEVAFVSVDHVGGYYCDDLDGVSLV